MSRGKKDWQRAIHGHKGGEIGESILSSLLLLVLADALISGVQSTKAKKNDKKQDLRALGRMMAKSFQ